MSKGILVILLSALLLAVSVFCVIETHDHDCCGEDCPVCTMVQNFEHTAKSLLPVGAAAAAVVLVLWTARALAGMAAQLVLPVTPVLLNIRSNS